MNLQAANMADLLGFYYRNKPTEEVALKIQASSTKSETPSLENLFRHHSVLKITDPEEVRLRKALDDLLSFYGVLEICILTGFIAPPEAESFWLETNIVLHNPAVKAFYTQHYPVKLPQLLAPRLCGRNSSQLESPVLARIVCEFLELDQRFLRNHGDGVLLYLLDDFRVGDTRFSQIVKVIEQPQEFIDELMRPPENKSVVGRALREFSLFLEFASDLLNLLKRLRQYPVLQSEIWNQYSYWFGFLGQELEKQLGEALGAFLNWKPLDDPDHKATTIQDFVAGARAVLNELVSEKWAKPVDALLKQLEQSGDDDEATPFQMG